MNGKYHFSRKTQRLIAITFGIVFIICIVIAGSGCASDVAGGENESVRSDQSENSAIESNTTKPGATEDQDQNSGSEGNTDEEAVVIPDIGEVPGEIISSLEKAWFEENSFPLFSDPENRKLSVAFYYGIYGDNCVVLFERSQLTVETAINIEEYEFRCTSSFILYAFKDGKLTRVKEAYENGYLTDEDIAEIKAIHDEVQKNKLDLLK